MGGFRIGQIAGIPIRLHWSLLLFGAFVALSSGGGVLGALLSGVLLFGSIVLHELGHAMVARGYGIQTRDIVLTPIGGIARIEGMPRSGRAEVAIAIAGPIVSLAIAGLAASALWLLPVKGIAVGLLSTLMWTNAMLGLFNLIPAFPMDGGRVLRGALSHRIGLSRATDIAANVGRVAAIVMGVFGLATGNVSLALVAVFVWMAGGRERAMVKAEQQPRAWDVFGRPIEVEMVERPTRPILRRPVVVYRY